MKKTKKQSLKNHYTVLDSKSCIFVGYPQDYVDDLMKELKMNYPEWGIKKNKSSDDDIIEFNLFG